MAKKSKNTKVELCSLDEELMVCSAYRYAIGRHTYINSLANYIAKEYYNRLTPERLSFTSKDMISTINDQLQWGPCGIHYDGSVSYEDRNALDDLLIWMEQNVSSEKDLDSIDHIEVYKESYSKDSPKLYRVYQAEPPIKKYNSQMDIDDLLNWYTLAKVFDKSSYKVIHVKNGKLEQDIIVVQSWHRMSKEIEGNPGYFKYVEWRWEKCWVSVDDFIKKGEYAGYIPEEYVISIDDYVVNEDSDN